MSETMRQVLCALLAWCCTGAIAGDWELVTRLSEGRWSTVYAARPRQCAPDWPADYAVKVADLDEDRRQQAERLLAREAAVGRSVSGRHLVQDLYAGHRRWLCGRFRGAIARVVH